MNLEDSYRRLGLRTGAPFSEVKTAYRRLARLYHPDANPNDQAAQARFIEIAAAYKFLAETLSDDRPGEETTVATTITADRGQSQSADMASGNVRITQKSRVPAQPKSDPPQSAKTPAIQFNPELSALERRLKQESYQQLQALLRSKRFPRAITLAEGLAQRIPKDAEVRQWQAITYYRWGKDLVSRQQVDKARVYLKKALRTDPHNRSLWAAVEQEFRQLEKVY